MNPGPEVQTDEELLAWLKKYSSTTWHTTSTCSMLPKDKGGVVDPRLKVYGTKNVRVADLSIAPLMPCGHTQSVAYTIGEIGERMQSNGLGTEWWKLTRTRVRWYSGGHYQRRFHSGEGLNGLSKITQVSQALKFMLTTTASLVVHARGLDFLGGMCPVTKSDIGFKLDARLASCPSRLRRAHGSLLRFDATVLH